MVCEEREVWLGEGFCLLCPGGAGSLLTATRQHCFHATAALCSAQGAQLHIALVIGHYTIDTTQLTLYRSGWISGLWMDAIQIYGELKKCKV